MEPYRSSPGAPATAAAATPSLFSGPSAANMLATLIAARKAAGALAAASAPGQQARQGFTLPSPIATPHQGKPKDSDNATAAPAAPAAPSALTPEGPPEMELRGNASRAGFLQRDDAAAPASAAAAAADDDGAGAAAAGGGPPSSAGGLALFGSYANSSVPMGGGRRLLAQGDITNDYMIKRGNVVYAYEVQISTDVNDVGKDGIVVLSKDQDITIQVSPDAEGRRGLQNARSARGAPRSSQPFPEKGADGAPAEPAAAEESERTRVARKGTAPVRALALARPHACTHAQPCVALPPCHACAQAHTVKIAAGGVVAWGRDITIIASEVLCADPDSTATWWKCRIDVSGQQGLWVRAGLLRAGGASRAGHACDRRVCFIRRMISPLAGGRGKGGLWRAGCAWWSGPCSGRMHRKAALIEAQGGRPLLAPVPPLKRPNRCSQLQVPTPQSRLGSRLKPGTARQTGGRHSLGRDLCALSVCSCRPVRAADAAGLSPLRLPACCGPHSPPRALTRTHASPRPPLPDAPAPLAATATTPGRSPGTAATAAT